MTKISNQYSLTNILTADLANSRLGINNVSPTVALDVTGAGKFSSSVTATGVGLNPSLRLTNTTATTGVDWHLYSLNNGNLGIFNNTSSAYALQITSTGAATFSGNVGIGGGTPSIFTAYSIASFGSLSTTTNGITIASTTTGNGLIEFADGTTGSQAYRGYIQYAHTSDSLSFGTAGSDRMIITSAGNVGIGTTSPAVKLNTFLSSDLSTIQIRAESDTSSVPTYLGMSAGTIEYSRPAITSGILTIQTKVSAASSASGGGAIVFSPNGTVSDNTPVERMRILMNGNVGIGTSSPDQLVSIRKTSAGAETIALALQNIGGTAGTAVSMIFCPHENSSTPEPLAKISGIRTAASGANTDLGFYTYGVGGLIEKMRLTSLGQINVNHSTTNYDIAYFTNGSASPYGMNITFTGAAPNNTTNNFIYLADTSGLKCRIVSNGSIYNSTGTYGSISDIKLKENIVDTTPKLENLLKVKVRNYNLIGDKLKQIGVVAQELETIFPSLVEDTFDKETNETTKSVKYSVFVPILIKAIQELSAKVSLLENK